MATSRRTGRSRLTLALCVVVSVVAITLDYRGSTVIDGLRGGALDVVGPVRDAAGTVTEPLTDAWHGITGYDDLEQEHAALRAELDDLRRQLLDGADAERRYQELLDLLDLDGLDDLALVRARVVSSSPSNFDLTVEIDRGSSDGLVEGQPVVAGGGLLMGRVVQVARSRSSVQVVTDPAFRVGVTLPASGAVGTAYGQGTGSDLTVAHLQPTAKVDVGDVVKTTGGAGSAYPPDLILGTVSKVVRSPGAATLDVWVTPAAPVDASAYVQVVQWDPDGVTANLRLGLVVLALLVLQLSLASGLPVFGVTADLLLVVAVAAALAAGPDRGAAIAFLVGLTYDLVLQTPFGLTALTYCLVAFAVGQLQSSWLRPSWWIPWTVTAVASAGGTGLYALLATMVGVDAVRGGRILVTMAVVAGWNLVWGPLVRPLVGWALGGESRRAWAR